MFSSMKLLPFSLRLTIPMVLLFMGCITGAISHVRRIHVTHERVKEELSQRAKLTALTTTQVFEFFYRREGSQSSPLEGIKLVISRMSGDSDLKTILFCDEENSILRANRYELQNKSLDVVLGKTEINALEDVRRSQVGRIIISENQQKITAIYPVIFPPNPTEIRSNRIGAVILEYDLVEAKQLAIADARQQSLQIVLIVALLCVLVALFLEQIITKRANKLVRATKQFAKGNYETRIALNGSDELVTVANAFNQMAAQIQEETEALQQSEKQLISQTEALEVTLQELGQTQIQLVQQEKMSSLGQLVAGIAHEINNPVNFIFANLNHLQEYSVNLLDLIQCYQDCYPDVMPEIEDKIEDIDLEFMQEDLLKIIKSMQIGAERIRKIVLSLRNFSRLDESDMKEVDLQDGIESTLMILQHRLKKQGHRPEIEIIRDYGDDVPQTECYIGQLNQVIMNIFANAIDAVEDMLDSIPKEDRKNHPAQITVRTSRINDQWVEIAIADNGLGMPEEIKAKIFNPFFTTKAIGKGTGMGMSISYQVITEKHGGKLECNSTMGKGTEFKIQIPIRQSINQSV